MKTNTRLYSVLNCTVHVSVCRRFVCQRFWSVDVLVFRRFGLVWFVDVLVCRCFGLSTFRSVDALVCWCFGMSTFRFVDVLVVDVSVCRRFDQLPTKGSTLTHQILFINMVIILQTTYQNGFLQWHFSQSRSPWVLLLKYNLHFTLHRLYIVNIFPTFKHLTRASHHWCLASNIVLVQYWNSDQVWWRHQDYLTLHMSEDWSMKVT